MCRVIGGIYDAPVAKSSRAYTPRAMTKVVKRDGFIDRYNGSRLVFPPVLRLLSRYYRKSFRTTKTER